MAIINEIFNFFVRFSSGHCVSAYLPPSRIRDGTSHSCDGASACAERVCSSDGESDFLEHYSFLIDNTIFWRQDGNPEAQSKHERYLQFRRAVLSEREKLKPKWTTGTGFGMSARRRTSSAFGRSISAAHVTQEQVSRASCEIGESMLNSHPEKLFIKSGS